MKRLNGKFATDTAYGKVKSLRGNIGSQLFSHQCGFKACYPLRKIDGNNVGDALTQFISDYGVPERLVFDGASVQTGPKTRFMDAYVATTSNITFPVRGDQTKIQPNKGFMNLKKDGIE
jgi:hypothetical protein